MIRSALAIIFLMFLILSDFANAGGKILTAAYEPKAQTVLTEGPTKTLVQTVDAAGETCEKRALLARKLCLEEFNPDIQAAMPIITALTVATSNMVDACSKMGEAMKIANAALTAYNISCSAAKVACDSACGTATKSVQAAPGEIDKIKTTAESACKAGATCVEASAATGAKQVAIPAAAKEIAALKDECSGHAQRLTTASVGLLSVIASGKKANKCEEGTTIVDCNLNPTDATCVANVDCSIATNSTKTVCICARAPNSAGCAGAGLEGGGDYSQSMAATADAAEKMGDLNPSGSYSGDLISPNGGGSAAGGGMGAPASGSGGGGVAGGSAAKGSGKSADGKALNTNILSGFEGGGGGGGRSGSSASGSDYDQYLPGGKKDPSRNVASQVFANGQVTGGGGKSNWEKVKDRYRDNRPKLMTGP